jgi:hypothetical protein
MLKKWGIENVDWIQLASNEDQIKGVVMSEVYTQNFHPEAWTQEIMWKPWCGWEGSIEVKRLGWVLEHPGSWSVAVAASCYAAILDQLKKYYFLQNYSVRWSYFNVI